MIIVFSDSHARSFGCFENVVPVFVGPAAFNNFLTKKEVEYYFKKLLSFLAKCEREQLERVVIMYGSGIRHYKSINDQFFELKEATALFSKKCIELAEIYAVDVTVIGPVPPAARLEESSSFEADAVKNISYMLNELFDVLTKCDYRSFPSELCTDTGFVHNRYLFDFIHINTNVADNLLKMSGDGYCRSLVATWNYMYELECAGGIVKIWGDIEPNVLAKNEFEELDLSVLSKRNQDIDMLYDRYLHRQVNDYLLVVNPHDGYPLLKYLLSNINGRAAVFDFEHSLYGEKLRFVLTLFGVLDRVDVIRSEYEFIEVAKKKELCDVLVLDVGWYKPQVLRKLIQELSRSNRRIFIYSDCSKKKFKKIIGRLSGNYINNCFDLSCGQVLSSVKPIGNKINYTFLSVMFGKMVTRIKKRVFKILSR